jgi:tRNA pseudouridine55 synthase
VDGLVLVDKPAGKTSHDLTLATRRSLGVRKAGHAGTLDPFATGLLIVLVGAGTRMQRFLMELPKTYRTTARLGWTSDTGDTEGNLVETGNHPPDPLELPTGELMQRPPAYSAVKIDGERAYKKARRGEVVEAPARPITVYRFEQLWRDDERAAFEIECSAGTYIRQLVADLGDAYCEQLERTAIGPFKLEGADPERLVPLELALAFLPEQQLTADEARKVSNGVRIESRQPPTANCQPVRLTHDGYLVAIGEERDSMMQPTVVIPQ